MAQTHRLLSSFVVFFFFNGAFSATFTLTNNCAYTVWPGILSGAGTTPLQTTGFALSKGESQSVSVPASWSGRFWGRTLCSTDSTGKFTCLTGDCGSDTIQCSGGAAPPATLAEFTLAGNGGTDFFDVSLVDGYNLPMLVSPQDGGSGPACANTGCLADLNSLCPSDLRVTATDGSVSGAGVACRSACEAFGTPEYCCSGEYGSPGTCKPSAYSQLFKNACPRSYSYAYDDATSTFTCATGIDYAITFCPAPTASQKSAQNNPEAVPLVNATMEYGGSEVSSTASSAERPAVWLAAVVAFSVFQLMLYWSDPYAVGDSCR